MSRILTKIETAKIRVEWTCREGQGAKEFESVQELATQFYKEQRRHVYINTKIYLDTPSLFKDQVDERQLQLQCSLDRLKNSIEKLESTNL